VSPSLSASISPSISPSLSPSIEPPLYVNVSDNLEVRDSVAVFKKVRSKRGLGRIKKIEVRLTVYVDKPTLNTGTRKPNRSKIKVLSKIPRINIRRKR